MGLAERHTGLRGLHGFIVELLHFEPVPLDLLLINVHSVADPLHLVGELVPRVLLGEVERSLRAIHGEEVAHLIVGEPFVFARVLHRSLLHILNVRSSHVLPLSLLIRNRLLILSIVIFFIIATSWHLHWILLSLLLLLNNLLLINPLIVKLDRFFRL